MPTPNIYIVISSKKKKLVFFINSFIQQGSFTLERSDRKYIYDVTKYYFKWLLFFWVFYSSKNIQNIKQHNCFQHW